MFVRVRQHLQPPQHAVSGENEKKLNTHRDTLKHTVVVCRDIVVVVVASQDTRSEDAKREQKTEQRWQLTELHRSALQNKHRDENTVRERER